MLIPFNQLWKKYNIQAKQCLHLGANEGQEAEEYHACGIERVLWVEAIPKVHLKLVTKLAMNGGKWPHDKALCACVSDEDGKVVVFNIASNEGQSSSFLEFGTHSKEHPSVRYVDRIKLTTIRVDTLLKRHKFQFNPGSFLNIDLQGAELLALKGMGDTLKAFDYVYVEVNTRELYIGCPFVQDIDAYLAPFGLIRRETKMTGNGWGDAFYTK